MSDGTYVVPDVWFARRRFLSTASTAVAAGLISMPSMAAAPPSPGVPPFVRRGMPGPFQFALDPLAGVWRVDKKIFIAIGDRRRPAVSSGMTCRRHWFAGHRHLEDVTTGVIGGSSYYRLGVLGFSDMDRRYEWVTFDALNANMMVYVSAPLGAPTRKIVMTGSFTDQGLLGEAYAGKSIPMRTVIEILGPDHHAIELAFMPPDEPEVLVDRSVYTRA